MNFINKPNGYKRIQSIFTDTYWQFYWWLILQLSLAPHEAPMGGLICSSRRQSYLLVCFLTFFNLFFCKIEHLFSSVCIWFKYNWILPNNVLKLGVTWSLTMEVNKSENRHRPHPISTPDFRPKLSECNSSVSLIMQSNGLGGSSLDRKVYFQCSQLK